MNKMEWVDPTLFDLSIVETTNMSTIDKRSDSNSSSTSASNSSSDDSKHN